MPNKWQDLKKKSQAINDTSKQDSDNLDERIRNSFKPIKAKTRTLFPGGGGKELSKGLRDYTIVKNAILRYMDGNNSKVSIDSVVGWFAIHYQWVFDDRPCIDYNRWNALHTFSDIMKVTGFSEQELAYKLCRWFILFDSLGFREYYRQDFNLSMLRKPWVLSALLDEQSPFKTKKSYY